MKKLFKTTMVMLMAAATLFATSCTEKEDDTNATTEANLIGEWGFTDNSQNPNITINADHTCKIGNQKYKWTLNDLTFKATQDATSNYCEFKIIELNGNVMKITGSRCLSGNTSEYSGSLFRTTVETPTELEDSQVIGYWKHYAHNENEFDDFTVTFNDDHTSRLGSYKYTWSISGNTISLDHSDDEGTMYATIEVKTITTSAKKVVMNVEGSRGWHNIWSDNDETFSGILVKTL